MTVLEGAAAVGQIAVSGSAAAFGEPERVAVPSSTGLTVGRSVADIRGVKVDPPVRADGCCATCGKPRNPERSERYGREFALRDPFCSSLCAMRWHGVPTPRELLEERQERIAGDRA